MRKLDPDRAEMLFGEMPGWALDGAAIRRQFVFAGFADAGAFVVRLGFAAEAADHHPDMLINYKRVTVTYSTHAAGGLTEKDFEGARAADGIAESMGAWRKID
jgi:4a-hydroxytetrahydrobiopterin dehydratase